MILGGMVLLHKDVESHERAWFLSVSEGERVTGAERSSAALGQNNRS